MVTEPNAEQVGRWRQQGAFIAGYLWGSAFTLTLCFLAIEQPFG